MTLAFLLLACRPGAPAEPAEPGEPPPDEDPHHVRVVAAPDAAQGLSSEPVDVLIVGAGVAGLAAAVEAVEAGANVRILEREGDFGGSANWSGGLMLFSGTPYQAEEGVEDSSETLLGEWASFTGGDPADPWVSAFAAQNVPMVYDWLVGLGVTFDRLSGDPSSGATKRVHAVAGGGTVLTAALEAPLDGPVIRYHAEALALVSDDAGRVIGVRWRDLDRDAEYVTEAGAVLVATGGFMHDLERVRAERPDLVDHDLRYGSWPGADGSGLAMVESVGGATQNLDAVGLYAHGVPAPGESHEELVTVFLGNVPWFNNLGERFVDESDSNAFQTGTARAAQPDGEAWALFDANAAQLAIFEYAVPDSVPVSFQDLDAAGPFVSGDDLDALAEALGVPGGALVNQVEAYNAYARGETAHDAFRDDRDGARVVDAPPFYAVPVAVTVAKGFGGVDVDLAGRVLDGAGAPIPGLYAAGELTGMAGGSLVGEYGFTGSLSAVVLGGRLAGRAAAEEALGE